MFRSCIIWIVLLLWMFLSSPGLACEGDGKERSPGYVEVSTSKNPSFPIIETNQQKSHHGITPDYLKLQYLRRSGQLSAGAGYRIHNFYEPALLIGYMYKPMKLKNGKASVLTLKNSFTLLGSGTSLRMAVKGGISVNFLLNGAISTNMAVYQRSFYYYQERLYSMPFISGEWYFNRQRRKSSLFVEVSTVDSAIRDAVDSEFVQFDEIWGLSIGLTFYLH